MINLHEKYTEVMKKLNRKFVSAVNKVGETENHNYYGTGEPQKRRKLLNSEYYKDYNKA